MTKPSGGICPIAMGKTLYRFMNHALCFQLRETFATHFSPHQFGVQVHPRPLPRLGYSSVGRGKCL
jgi:hypothetical protein